MFDAVSMRCNFVQCDQWFWTICSVTFGEVKQSYQPRPDHAGRIFALDLVPGRADESTSGMSAVSPQTDPSPLGPVATREPLSGAHDLR